MKKTKTCRYCGETVDAAARKCPACCKNLYPKPKDHIGEDFHCTNCNTPVYKDDNWCPNCGARFTQTEQDGEQKDFVDQFLNVVYWTAAVIASIAITMFVWNIDLNPLFKGIIIGIGGSFIGWGVEALFWLYFLPTIIAYRSSNPNIFFIFLINFLLGETVIGWLIAMGLALYFRYNPDE